LPGAEDADDAIRSIGKTAQLQFVTADGKIVLDGSQVKDAGITQDQELGGYAIALKFNKTGAEAFKQATTDIMNGKIVSTTQGIPGDAIMIILDEEIISSPVVNDIIPTGKRLLLQAGPAVSARRKPQIFPL
jgi:preprotein translocase subunit SecD